MRPADHRARVRGLHRRHALIRIGCSGWNYRHWRGPIYPPGVPARRWLELYAKRFDTVELNASFYRLPTESAAGHWAEQTPDGFTFAVKVSRYVTHVDRLRHVDEHLPLLLDRIEPLARAGKLGPLLWQLPPTFRRDDDRLAGALREFPPALRHAFEPRHESWFAPDVARLLREHNVALVVADRPGLRSLRDEEPTADFVYVRFHHGSRGRRGNYSRAELDRWARTIHGWGSSRDVYAYFNNDWEGFAPANASRLRSLLEVSRPARRGT